jgi:hypothetical protein
MICLIEDAVIEKDTIGKWCYLFAYNVKGANVNKLIDAIIKKDSNIINLIYNSK